MSILFCGLIFFMLSDAGAFYERGFYPAQNPFKKGHCRKSRYGIGMAATRIRGCGFCRSVFVINKRIRLIANRTIHGDLLFAV